MVKWNGMYSALRYAVITCGILLVPATTAEAQCLNKQQTRKAVQDGKALQLSAVRGKVRGEIINAKLCRNGARYYYRITVLSKKGDVKTLKVNATQ